MKGNIMSRLLMQKTMSFSSWMNTILSTEELFLGICNSSYREFQNQKEFFCIQKSQGKSWLLSQGNKHKDFLILFLGLVIFFFCLSLTSAYSNASVQALNNLTLAKDCVNLMVEKEIGIKRVNESYQEALQLYSAQIALEDKKKTASYNLVLQYSSSICKIKDIAIEAQDRLEIFKRAYEFTQTKFNLSSMNSDYELIFKSFDEERFEDTIPLIEKGYTSMGEIEKTQTTLKLFYDTTSRSMKKFFIDNWKSLTIVVALIIIILVIFWKALMEFRARRKLNYLEKQKYTLNELIAKIQKTYFSDGKMSELEFNVKLEKYHEMIRDVDRQIPLVKEDIFRFGKEKKNEIKKKNKLIDNSPAWISRNVFDLFKIEGKRKKRQD